MSDERPVYEVVHGEQFHWVGDGLRVTNLFPSAADLGARISPFLMLDYHAPYDYAPTDRPRGVGVHPHRGFETVTLAFEGSVAHHDSTGTGGVIHPGDVQWMTAASGILHKVLDNAGETVTIEAEAPRGCSCSTASQSTNRSSPTARS